MLVRPCRWIAACAAALFLVVVSAAFGADFMFRARVNGLALEGKPLAWNDTQMALLARDGQLHFFDPRDAKEGQKIATRFFGYSMSEMKRELYDEFGKDFDITTTNHYIVVHPSGQKDLWAQRFEELYRSFNHYFRVRGFTLQEPDYPLVAVVFRDKAEYLKAANATGTSLLPNTLGDYDPATNRVYLYDVTADKSGVDWSQNAATIIHEATHQTAYNVGIHSRFTLTPRWLAEGLAMMFEARGVWDSQTYTQDGDRVNRERLQDFKDYLPRRKEGSLAQLIASDNSFQTDPIDAYAESWAFSFYLCETQPRLYAKYLAKTAARPLFVHYSAEQRLADFQEFFGSDMRLIEAKFLRWMDDLK
jgi:Protein of unknown function (DUF1570)